MPSIPHPGPARRITVGVDTHADTHVATAIDQLGVVVDRAQVPTTPAGYEQIERWASGLGPVDAFGVEGTGSYGAGLTRLLRRRGHRVVEVTRPDRSQRRGKGKSDPIDAELAARSVLSGQASATPKHADGDVEMLRLLKLTRASAIKARTQAINQLHAVVLTADELREQLRGLSGGALLRACAGLVTGPLTWDPLESTCRHASLSIL